VGAVAVRCCCCHSSRKSCWSSPSIGGLQGYADYVCLNLSCPNTTDGQGLFLKRERLARLLHGLDEVGMARPVLLNVAPFTGPADLDGFLAAAGGVEFARGFAVNLPPGKPAGLTVPAGMPGAVPGRPAERAANRTIRELHAAVGRDRQVIVGSGGVFDAEDATCSTRKHGVRRGQRGPRDRPATGWDAFTGAELKVAVLVAGGLSNPDIAARLFLSRRTVQTHVSHILAKLGARSRVEIARHSGERSG
jgi:DNA-binding CsgD family transcriptional regulator